MCRSTHRQDLENLQLDVQGSAWGSVRIQLKFLTVTKWDLLKKIPEHEQYSKRNTLSK